MQLRSYIASEGSKGETLQKPKNCAAAENTEAPKAVRERLDAEVISEDAAKDREAAQSKQQCKMHGT
jgi:hypothetical protein